MADEAATNEEQKPKSKLPFKTIIIVLGVLLLEGGTIGVFMLKDDPQPSAATEPIENTQESTKSDMAEVILAETFNVDNWTAGRSRILVTLEVTAKVKKDNVDKLNEAIEKHKTEIKDRIRTLVSSAPLEHIKDPDVQVLKRETKAGLEQILGEGLIEEILLPTWQSMPTD